MSFIVIDTEGRRELKEIAILDCRGKLIYEAFNQEHPEYVRRGLVNRPLRTILSEFGALAAHKTLVFHNASHDLKLLEKSFSKAFLPVPSYSEVYCTLKQAQKSLTASSYSLEYLAKKLNLKVEGKYFNRDRAHVARYDAQFTYQLYLVLQRMNSASPTINPFGSSRVDHPFQSHPDNANIYHTQYITLESVIDDIKSDRNHQSKGAVIIGQPGTGKTHLIMRLAQQRLKLNRLLFVPCPNDAKTIKYHIYSSILESLNQTIPGTGFNQLEYFLANTFVGILKSTSNDTQKIQSILERIQDDPLKLYEILGGEGTQTRRNNWDYVEKFTSDWWFEQYGSVGYAPEIIKGIVKFCRYSNPSYKQLIKKWLAADELEPEELTKVGLSGWHEEISKEDFSLDAIAVLGKLSLLHEPLIIVFDQLEMLGLEHNRAILLNFGEAVKEIFTRVPYSLIIFNLFPNRWQQLQQTFDGSIIDRISQYQVRLDPPTKTEVEDILQLKAQAVDTNLSNLFTTDELQRIIGNHNSIRRILNNAAEYFRYKYKNIPLPQHPIETAVEERSSITNRLDKLESQQNRLEQLLRDIAGAFGNFATIAVSTEKTSDNSKAIAPQDIQTPPNLEPSLEQKVTDYLFSQYQILERNYSEAEILHDENDVGKLQNIVEAFKKITALETDLLPSKRVLPPHRVIINQQLCIGFLSSKGSKFTARMQNLNEFVATDNNLRFKIWRDIRSDAINPKTIGRKEIDKLNNAKNGEFLTLERNNRINFELIYKFISDIYNQDLDLNIETEFKPALEIVAKHFCDYWLIKELVLAK